MNRKRIREALLAAALQPRNFARSVSQSMPGTTPRHLTLIVLDGQWLKLMQVEGPPQSRTIAKLAVCPVQGATMEEVRGRLREACEAQGIVPAEVLAANATHLCTVRLFSLPSTDPKEIRDIVDLPAEKHTPYAKEEILTDFKILDRERTGYSRVLLVIAHQDVVHRSVSLVDASGWTLERVGCELEGLVTWLGLVKKAAGGKPAAGASLIVDVDANNTILLIVHRGQPQFQRSLATGMTQLEDDPARAGERMVGELQRSIEAWEAEGGTVKVQEVLVTGPVAKLGALKAQVERGLSLPVSLVPPWQGCALSDNAKASLQRLPDVSFASLIGLAADAGELDLTPPATKLRLAFETRAKALVLLGCQCIAAFILLSLLFIGRAQKEERYHGKLKALYERTARQAGAVEQAAKQLQFVEDQMRQQGKLLQAVDTLAKRSPPEIAWTSLSYTHRESVVLAGVADQLPKVYEFSGSIASAPDFGAVEARRVAKRKAGEEDVTDFELRCPLGAASGVGGAK